MAKPSSKTKTVTKPENTKISAPLQYQAVGRRKEATARVRFYVVVNDPVTVKGKSIKAGDMVVNGRDISAYFPGTVYRIRYTLPFILTQTANRFAVWAIVEGGGLSGQLDAFVHGASRTLLKVDPSFRPVLKKQGLLTRDPRAKERRKAGFAQGARAKKQSPKR